MTRSRTTPLGNYFIFSIFLTTLGSASLTAEINSVSDIYQNNLSSADRDRREKHKDANRQIDETNQNKLQPNMQQHNDLAKKHFEEAEEARKQKQEGKAQEEERKGLMELMKAQQLNQQIQANKKTRDENEQNAQRLQNQEPTQLPKVSRMSPNKEEADKFPAEPSRAALAIGPSPDPSVPSTQLVNLASIPLATTAAVTKASNSGTSVATAESTEKAPQSEADKEISRATFGYDEKSTSTQSTSAKPDTSRGWEANSKNPSTTQSSQASTSPRTTASITTSLAQENRNETSQLSPLAPIPKNNRESGNQDFFPTVGSLVERENQDWLHSEGKLSLRGLRGASEKKEDKNNPNAGLSDEAFWKKVGKEPLKCKAATVLSQRRRKRCLKEARKELEKKWNDDSSSQPTPQENPRTQLSKK